MKLSPDEKTFFRVLYDAGAAGLPLGEWNAQAKEAGLGLKRPAKLFDLRSNLVSKRLVREYGGRWRINHNH